MNCVAASGHILLRRREFALRKFGESGTHRFFWNFLMSLKSLEILKKNYIGIFLLSDISNCGKFYYLHINKIFDVL
jgi:hypothetical protein